MWHHLLRAAALAAALAAPPTIRAQEPSASDPSADAERKKLEEEIQRELRSAAGPSAPSPPAAPAAAPGGSSQGGSAVARVLLLPDIGAIGNLSLAWDDRTRKPAFAFEELELSLQAVVDPYLRADVFLSFTPGAVDVEEAYVTTLGLPGGFLVRAGKLKSPFGRLNQTHPHVQEFVEGPLATRLLAEESLGGPGVDVAWLAPLPWFAELHLAAQSIAPTETDASRLTGLARLSQYFALGDAATLGAGLSAARRDEAPGQFRDLAGADLFLRVRPPASRSYLALTAELHARRFVGLPGVAEGFERGWWTQAFYRAGPYLGAGARYEQAPARDAAGDERRVTGVLAWFPSEFERLRLEISRDRLPGGEAAVEAFLNLEFGIGAHGAHPF
jgi:hypothetical protein